MGDRYFRTSDGVTRSERLETKQVLKPGESFYIPPGQFAYLLTKETVTVPGNAMAFISMRTAFKFQGLINVSGFHVDPGYSGKLLYAVFNAGPSPVPITEDELLFKIWFCDLDSIPPPQIPMSDDLAPPGSGIFDIDNRLIHGMTPPVVSLQGLASSQRRHETALKDLKADMERRFEVQKPTLDSLATVWQSLMTGLLAGLALALASILVSFIWPIAHKAGESVTCYIWNCSPTVASPKPLLETRPLAPAAARAPEMPPTSPPTKKAGTQK